MRNLRSPRLSVSGLEGAPAPLRASKRRLVILASLATAGVLGLAWFDGGEEPLHPIAEVVALPEQG